MRGTLLDTNIFLRHLLNDVPGQSAACHSLFQSIERGRAIGWTSALVVAEIVFVLSNPRTYNVDRAVIRDQLLPLLNLRNLKLERKHLYARVFDLYVTLPIDFVDAYHAALLEHDRQREVYSYDQDFDVVPTVSRREP